MSNFCDQTVVEFIAGKGGDGSVSFRREKFVPRGGPDGGDGGKGGSIVLQADENLNTLMDFNTQKVFKSPDGGNGHKKKMHGRDGEDLILSVPAGTLIIDDTTKDLLCDLKSHGQRFVVARGGRGGMGNTHFKSSIHQAPLFAETGEEGIRIKILLELQLVADVGIIGFPSAGKSTLISRISNARPKIADYPFTTLIPNLGVVNMAMLDRRMKDSFVVADIPGLIEGAHTGKGLGHEFLRHISRTELLVHLVDPTREDVNDFNIINRELEAFDKRLSAKDQLVAITKTDVLTDEQIEKYKKALIKKSPKLKNNLFLISSVTGAGIKELVFEMNRRIKLIREKKEESREKDQLIIKSVEKKIFRPHLEKAKFTVTYRRVKSEAATGKMRKIFDIKGERIEQVVKMTDTYNPEGLERIYHFMDKMGIKSELRKQGAQPGDRVRIAGKTFLMRS